MVFSRTISRYIYICLSLSSFSAYADDPRLNKILAIQQAQIASLSKTLEELKETVVLLKQNVPLIVFNSVANPSGPNAPGDANTLKFWQIPYAERLQPKGMIGLQQNYYNPRNYVDRPATYIDEIEDLNGHVVTVMVARAQGFDKETMKFKKPEMVSGMDRIYSAQFAQGWSSKDKDFDSLEGNCAAISGGVTQHYSGCWIYNLGASSDGSVEDSNWGPHIHSAIAADLGLKREASNYSRVRRITRYVTW